MFGLGFFEVLLIMVIALIVFGPEKLPEFARSFGKLTAEVRKNTDALRKEFYNSVYPPAKQIKDELRELKTAPLKKLNKTLESMDNPFHCESESSDCGDKEEQDNEDHSSKEAEKQETKANKNTPNTQDSESA